MSNTYFSIKKQEEHKEVKDLGLKGYKNSYRLSLTAFMGNPECGNVQLTIRTESTIPSQNGIGYISLNDKEIDLLIAGLLERKLDIISATSDNQSIFSPAEE